MCEFITAGGFNHADLPASLVHEGALMRDALLRDLSELPYHISIAIDRRLKRPENCHECVEIGEDDDAWKIWEEQISQADAVWLIAPETDGLLKKLTESAVLHGKLILGCGLKAIEICSDKLSTFLALTQAEIPTIATYTIDNWPKTDGCWVAKPRDGAGCSDTVFFENARTLMNWLAQNNKSASHVIQPYQQGIAASISCVMHQGRAQILSCNKQLISIKEGVFYYSGSEINGMQYFWNEFALFAQKIAAADLHLNGYIGIDVIVKPDNSIVMLEINPRLTTSYVGLAQATGENPAELIINTLTKTDFMWPKLKRNIVNIHV